MSHMTQSARRIIKDALDHGERDFDALGTRLGKNRTTICREIRKRRISPQSLPDQEITCPLLVRPPYVCNGCPKRQHCRQPKWWYEADAAHAQYRKTLVESREGVDFTSEELDRMNAILYKGTLNGQSVHHIMVTHRDDFIVCEKTVYNMINTDHLAVKRHHLPEAAYRKRRPRKSKPRQHRVERSCRTGRTYDDYLAFVASHPETHVVEMDSVIGRKGGRLLLTLNLNCCGLMLAFLRDANTAKSVKDILDMLEMTLGLETFRKLFPVILTDNGSEFTDPEALEKDQQGNSRTRIFYCNPYASYEKPHVENNHENLRRFIPKGRSMDAMDQRMVNRMLSHMNSFARKEYGDTSAIERFVELYGEETLAKLGIAKINSEDVCLKPSLVEIKE